MKIKSNKYVWIVDSNPETAAMAEEILLSLGYSSMIFDDPDLLKETKELSPLATAIILDEQCLKNSNCQYIESLSEQLYSIPIIVASEIPEEGMWVHYIQKGAVDLITKPYVSNQLKKALKLSELRTKSHCGSNCFTGEIQKSGDSPEATSIISKNRSLGSC